MTSVADNQLTSMQPSFGIIFHWGVYSVPAYDDPTSAARRKIQNGSEWYAKRLSETGAFRPVTGWKETQEHHKKLYGAASYEDFASKFTACAWNPDNWMKLCRSVGATYVILTAKHHDGFCLFRTTTRKEWNSADIGPRKDLIKLFADAARRHKLGFGVYYSWTEFNRPCTKEYLNSVVIPQIRELMCYAPDIWWFDGDWGCTTKASQQVIDQLCDEIHAKFPESRVNDRVGRRIEREDPTFLGKANYRVYHDRALPKTSPRVSWEHINTIGQSWGRNKAQTISDYKTAAELTALYQKVKAMDGSFLLNLGPNADGTLDAVEVDLLQKFGLATFGALDEEGFVKVELIM